MTILPLNHARFIKLNDDQILRDFIGNQTERTNKQSENSEEKKKRKKP